MDHSFRAFLAWAAERLSIVREQIKSNTIESIERNRIQSNVIEAIERQILGNIRLRFDCVRQSNRNYSIVFDCVQLIRRSIRSIDTVWKFGVTQSVKEGKSGKRTNSEAAGVEKG